MTLTELFTNIANAIRSKTGSTAKITPTNFATEISNIKTLNKELIAYFSDFHGQTKYSATGINVTLQPGTYVLKGRIVCPGTCWSMQNLNNVNIPMTLNGSTENEFTVTTADSNFNTYYYIDGSYGSVDYVLYQIA